MLRKATPQDYAKILEIYNQVIDSRTVTADLTYVTVQSRADWFDFHNTSKRYPLWVYELNGAVVAWASLSPYYGRAAYDGVAEVSFYVDSGFHGRGIGSACVAFLIEEMQALEFHTLVGFVFASNQPSLSLLQKFGFDSWGRLPKVANMGDHDEDLVILGYSTK